MCYEPTTLTKNKTVVNTLVKSEIKALLVQYTNLKKELYKHRIKL